MAKVRTFIAVDIPSQVRDRARQLIDCLRASGAEVTWVRPENLHLTLKFLGDVPDVELGKVCRAVEQSAARAASFEVFCGGAGAFPDVRRPRTIWMGLQRGEQEMAALHAGMDKALAKAGYPRDNRRYHPHLTIGRLRRGGGPQQQDLSRLIQDNSDYEAGPTFVTEAIVFSSVLQKSGPTYEVLARAPLTG